jgi:GNAT acetyltransferase-like protein
MDLLPPRRGPDRGGEEGALRAAVNPALRIEPVVLAGEHVTLVPMAEADVEPLAAIGLDPELWRWIPVPVTSLEEMRLYVRTALDEAESGLALPFTIKSLATGETIGTTRYANIRADDLGLEIGWTWLAPNGSAPPPTPKPSCCCLAMRSSNWGRSGSSSRPTF